MNTVDLLAWVQHVGGYLGILALAVATAALFGPRPCSCSRDLSQTGVTRRADGARRAAAGHGV